MKPGYVLRQAAEADLEEIWLHTFRNWGSEQADAYLRALLSRLDWLAAHPRLGKPRPDIKPGYVCFPEGRHLIFYTIQAQGIEVIGILHQNMDYLDHFEPDRQ